MIELIKKTLKSNSLGRTIYPTLNKIYRLYSVPARQRRLKRVGYDVLDELQTISLKENIAITPIFGTLLGLVRDGGFIHNDDDIDLGVFPGVSPKQVATVFIEKYGYKYRHGLAYHGECTEFTLEHKSGLTVDFFFMQDNGSGLLSSVYFWKEGEPYTDVRQNNLKWVKHPYVTKSKVINISDIDISIPDNSEDWLYYAFGSGWKVPDPNYTDDKQPGKIPVDGYGYSITYNELITNNIPQ